MNEFLQRIEKAVVHRHLLSRGQKILVAVSGGVDSMVLLHALHSHAAKHRWKISVAHFNHRLRGGASDADEKLVRQAAAKLRLKCFAGGADVKNVAAQSKISVEMAARKLRHEFLARTAREQKISTIALAHHADDQVELFFLRLLRGAGGEGLAGMKWRSPSPAGKTVSLVRPLLDFSKTQLLEFARENRIRFRDDATNFSTDFVRNRIRHELLPLLRKQYQPALDKTVLRLMDIVGAEAEFAGKAAREWLQKSRRGGCDEFTKLPLAVQRKVLQQQLTGLGLLPDFELVERLRSSPGKRVSVATGLAVARNPDGAVRLLDAKEQGAERFHAGEVKLDLSDRAGDAEFGGRRFRWGIQARKHFRLPERRAGGPAARREFFDVDKIGDEITLRHWRPGDRFRPIGLNSAAKLQDLFVNAKIPAARRRELVLAVALTGEIFWVEGLRIGEQFKLTPGTRRKLAWNWSKIAG